MFSWLTDADATDPARAGGKAARLAAAAAAGFDVPEGFVVPADTDPVDEAALVAAAARLGDRVAVRSSAVAEDLASASFAGLYESYLDVAPAAVPDAVRRCRLAAAAYRVAAYHPAVPGARIGVLVQAMVAPDSAGVAFTADPVTGARDQVVVTAVPGVAADLVAGTITGEQWRITAGRATPQHSSSVLTRRHAVSVATIALRLQALFDTPQDVEWALTGDRVHVLQTRPMTALPPPVSWAAPGPGLWACNFRLGEWLPEPVTPLFGDWLLPVFDHGFRAGMLDTAGAAVAIPYALVNGWYYATPNPPLARIPAAVLRSRGRLVRFMLRTVIQPTRAPVRADRSLQPLYLDWRSRLLPQYQQLAAVDPDPLNLDQLIALAERIVHTAGRHFWYLVVVGGAAWKMERALRRFHARHGLGDIDAAELLTGLDPPSPSRPHAVHSLDWFHPTTGEHPPPGDTFPARPATSHDRLEAECRDRLARQPRDLAAWTALTAVVRRYARIRHEQADNLTLGWPLLRRCGQLIGHKLTETGVLDDPDPVFFLTRDELQQPRPATQTAAKRQQAWQDQRKLTPPLLIGRPPPLIGDQLAKTVRGTPDRSTDNHHLVGQPASPGRATGTVRIVHDLGNHAALQGGEVLVAPALTPSWTPLLRQVVAVITDRGTAAAHAAIIAREYGIPAVVATADATRRLHDGDTVTVDGGRGLVYLATAGGALFRLGG